MVYKILLLDVDGTIVAPKAEALPSQRVIASIQVAQKHLHVALATGRSIDYTRDIIDEIGLQGPSVFNGGAEIIDVVTGKEMYHKLLSAKTMRELYELAAPFGFKIYAGENKYNEPITASEQILKPAAMFFMEAVDSVQAIKLLEKLTAVRGTAAHPTLSWEDGDVVDIHVTHEHATKRHGVERLIKMLGCSKNEVLAIGDGHNDIPLLEAAGFKVAMGNAPDEVKAVADYVAPSLKNDGVSEAIQRFILT